jgi:hypothetical protein
MIGRILIILLAATVVVGVAWLLTRNGANAQFAPGGAQFRPGGDFGGEGFVPGQPPEGFNPSQRLEGLREGGFDRDRRSGGFLPFGWIKNFLLIAVIVAVVVFVEYLLGKRRLNRVLKAPKDDTQIA